MISDKGKKKLLAFHGLDPEKHTDEDVDNCINNAVTPADLEDLQNRAKAGDEARTAQVENDLKHYAPRIGEKAETVAFWKEQLLNNRAGAVAALDALPELDPKRKGAPLHNRQAAGNPGSLDAGDAANQVKETKENALIKNRASEYEKKGIASATAWIMASREVPAEIASGLHK